MPGGIESTSNSLTRDTGQQITDFEPSCGESHQLETMLAVCPLKALQAIKGFSFPFR
jgi:hypothetical protein